MSVALIFLLFKPVFGYKNPVIGSLYTKIYPVHTKSVTLLLLLPLLVAQDIAAPAVPCPFSTALSRVLCYISLAVAIMEFSISHTWSGNALSHSPLSVTVHPAADGCIKIETKGIFFNDPMAPKSPPGVFLKCSPADIMRDELMLLRTICSEDKSSLRFGRYWCITRFR